MKTPADTTVTEQDKRDESSSNPEEAARPQDVALEAPQQPASAPSQERSGGGPPGTEPAPTGTEAAAVTTRQEPVVAIPEAEEPPTEAPALEPPPSPTAPTTRLPAVKKAEPGPKTPRFSPPRLVLGGLLILGGIAWLLDVTNATNVNWGVLLSIALIGAGGGLVLLGLRGGMNRGLVVLGAILAIILTAAAALRIDIAGGIGSQTIHPVSANALGKTYHLAVGQMTIDLRHLSFQGGTHKVKATVGMGQLVVLVPPNANVRVHARAGVGMVSAFNHSQSGLDVDHTFNHGSGPPVVTLELSVGLGQVTVHK